MRVLLLAAIAVLPGCIEGPEGDSVYHIDPRACETGLRADQAFVLEGRYELARQERLKTEPPRFVLDAPMGVIEMAVIQGDYGQLTLIPDVPLPPDADLSLRLVDPGALAGAYIPPTLFPATYSTRTATSIRTFRAIDGHIFVSFSQPLDAATMSAVHVQRGTTPISATVEYIDAPGHVVHLYVTDDAELDVVFDPSLRTKAGAVVFETVASVRVDPSYTLPEQNGCDSAE